MARPLRVAVITGEVLPWETDLWSACHRAGIEVTLIGKRTEVGDAAECPVRFLNPRVISSRSDNLWWLYPQLGDVLSDLSADVVHVHSEPWGLSVQQALLTVARRKLKSVVCAHGADNIFRHGPAVERAIRALALRMVFPRLGGYASWNADGVRLARRYGLPDATPTAVLPAVAYFSTRFPTASSEDKIRARDALGLPTDAFVVGFVGRLVPEKGVIDLIDAVASLGTGKAFLAIWGEGPLRAVLESRVAMGEFNGLLGGWLHFSRVPAALSACDVIAIPSYSTSTFLEQFSRVGLEAMLSQRAIVATQSGAFPAVFGDSAVLVPERDVRAITAALRDLAASESLREDLGARARARSVTQFAPERLVKRLLPMWEKAVANRRSTG
jgi:glycosyltransferase involved in cell wall biosynthesis